MTRKLGFALVMALAAPAALAQAAGRWDFAVRLDDRPVGSHSFVLEDRGDEQLLTSEARFDVKLLGITVYRYRHESRERWRQGCLQEIDARTDDNGTRTQVNGRQGPDGFAVQGQAERVPGCMMTFAYWHPRLPTQRRLLDPGSGKIVPVNITSLPGRAWNIAGPDNPIVIRRDERDRWSELDSVVSGRRLSYRLEPRTETP